MPIWLNRNLKQLLFGNDPLPDHVISGADYVVPQPGGFLMVVDETDDNTYLVPREKIDYVANIEVRESAEEREVCDECGVTRVRRKEEMGDGGERELCTREAPADD